MTSPTHLVVQVNSQGQLVIPTELQKVLNLKAGDTFCAYVENNKLILEKELDIKQKLKHRFAAVTESLADELIEERQHAVTLES